MIAWIESILSFPSDFKFIEYLVASVLLLVSVTLAFSFMVSTFSSLFTRK